VHYTSTKRALLVKNYITCGRGRYIMTTIACYLLHGKSYSEV